MGGNFFVFIYFLSAFLLILKQLTGSYLNTQCHTYNYELLAVLSNSILPNKQQYLWPLWMVHAVLLLLNSCFKNYDTTREFLLSVWVINCDVSGKLFLTGGGWNFQLLGWKVDLHWSCSWKEPRKSDSITESTWGIGDVSLINGHCFILYLFYFIFLYY